MDFILALAVHIGSSFILYCIASKFDRNITFTQMLVPFWNEFIIMKLVMNQAILYFWCTAVIGLILHIVSKTYAYDVAINASSNWIIAIFRAFPMSLIAQKLGKKTWLYFFLMLLPFPYVYLPQLVMAFDESKPVDCSNEQTSNDIIDK